LEDDKKDNDSKPNLTSVQRLFPHKSYLPREGNWGFIEGTDLSDAKLYHPDPSKFVLIRQMVYNNQQEEFLRYPEWETFDWNDPDSINHLNVCRRRIQRQTSPQSLWTLREKEKLKQYVSEVAKTTPSGGSMDWDKIATKMQSYFDGKTQKAGEDLALPSMKMVDDKEVAAEKKFLKLNTDRTGFLKMRPPCKLKRTNMMISWLSWINFRQDQTRRRADSTQNMDLRGCIIRSWKIISSHHRRDLAQPNLTEF